MNLTPWWIVYYRTIPRTDPPKETEETDLLTDDGTAVFRKAINGTAT